MVKCPRGKGGGSRLNAVIPLNWKKIRKREGRREVYASIGGKRDLYPEIQGYSERGNMEKQDF